MLSCYNYQLFKLTSNQYHVISVKIKLIIFMGWVVAQNLDQTICFHVVLFKSMMYVVDFGAPSLSKEKSPYSNLVSSQYQWSPMVNSCYHVGLVAATALPKALLFSAHQFVGETTQAWQKTHTTETF